ncbi:PucR family transcriptional regulator [Leucobacter sp. W1478]|uniref:PucR family transcriptional regulator n=1 Tax=Leucobacter sp. W1478 TaxID=3439065 RepID=UPI003F2BD147
MALDLTTVVRTIGGECLPQRLPDRTLIDGLATLDSYVVIGNPRYATLVTGSSAELTRRLGLGGADKTALAGAVFVSAEDSTALRDALQRHGMSAILGARVAGDGLHARLAALIAEDQAAVDRLVTAGMKILTQVARRGGVSAVVVELARQIDGWAVLLDAHGQLIASAGAGRLHIEDAVAVAFGRPVKIRHPGLQTHQVGSDRDLVGYLVISSRSRVTSRSRDLGQQSAALCDLLLRSHNPSLTNSLGREVLLETLLHGGQAAGALLRRWGVHETSLTAFAIGTKTRTVDLDRLTARWLDELGAEHVFFGDPGPIVGFVRDDLSEELEARARTFSPLGGDLISLGLAKPAPVDSLQRGAMQARQALRTAMDSEHSVLRYADIATVEYLLESVAGDASAQLSSLLDPLRDEDGEHGVLTQTLRVFLATHGAHRASASELGIHRHTLTGRIQRVEQLTGLSMSLADDRAAAWIALRAAGL